MPVAHITIYGHFILFSTYFLKTNFKISKRIACDFHLGSTFISSILQKLENLFELNFFLYFFKRTINVSNFNNKEK